jgi:hypothetical protein
MTNLTVGVITKMREILNAHPEIHQISGNKAIIYAIEDDIVDVKLKAIELMTADGMVRVDHQEMKLAKYNGDIITLNKHDNWREFIAGGFGNK